MRKSSRRRKQLRAESTESSGKGTTAHQRTEGDKSEAEEPSFGGRTWVDQPEEEAGIGRHLENSRTTRTVADMARC